MGTPRSRYNSALALSPLFARFCGDCATGAAKSGRPAAYTFEPLTMRDYGANL
jgi:hypothetical protein